LGIGDWGLGIWGGGGGGSAPPPRAHTPKPNPQSYFFIL